MVLFNVGSAFVVLATMILVLIMWKPRPGKILLCLSLFLAFIVSSMGVGVQLLMSTETGMAYRQYLSIYSFFSGTLHLTSVILLLCFVIIAGTQNASENHYDES